MSGKAKAKRPKKYGEDGTRTASPAEPTSTVTARVGPVWNDATALLALCAVVVACYLPALVNGFVYDDVPLILLAKTPRTLHEITGLVTQGHWNNLPYYRPLPRLALGLEKLAFGEQATYYHLINAGLMGLAAAAAFAIFRLSVLHIPLGIAWMAAALVALHPLASDTVYPASAGPETLLYVVTLLGAVYAFLRSGRRWHAAALALLAASLLSKEHAIVGPMLFLLADVCGLSADAPAHRWAQWPDWVKRHAPVAAVVIVYFVLRSYFVAQGASITLAVTRHPEGPLLSLLYTLQTIFAPAVQLVYEPRKTYWLVLWRQAVWVVAVLLLARAILTQWKALRDPLTFFAAWTLVALLPTANFFMQETQYAERYVLLPYVGVVGLTAVLAARIARHGAARHPIYGVGVLLVCLAAGISVFRGTYYRDDETFLAQWAHTDPQPVEALAMLGEDRFRAGNIDSAIATYRAAINANPRACSFVYEPLGRALEAKGKLAEAIVNYRQAVAQRPQDRGAAQSLALALHKQTTQDGPGNDRQPTEVSSHDPVTLLNLGAAADNDGHSDEALRLFRQALDRESGSQLDAADRADVRAKAHYNIGRVLAQRGEIAEAMHEYERALTENPQYAYAHTNLGLLLLDRDQVKEAIAHFEAALRANPNLTNAQGALDRARAMQRR